LSFEQETRTVTRVAFQARPGSARVNVYLDDAYSFSLAADVGLSLREGQLLDTAAIEELRTQDDTEVAYQYALRFLAYRPRSVSEVRRRLSQRGCGAPTVGAAIERLQRNHLVDDEEFGAYWVSQRQTFRPRGPRALRSELRAKGLDATTVDTALSSAAAGQDDAAYRAGAKRALSLASWDELRFTRTMTGYLLRRGFDYGVIRAAVQRLRADNQPPPQPVVSSPSRGPG
jgi:regulatory protein